MEARLPLAGTGAGLAGRTMTMRPPTRGEYLVMAAFIALIVCVAVGVGVMIVLLEMSR